MTGARIAAALLLLAAVGLSAGAVATQPAASGTPKRPNIVVLMTDDQTVESLRVMPNVKRLLGDRGATFAQSFASFPLCCPSRATFLTGQYAHNHGVLSNNPPRGGYEALDNANTLPVWLQRSGYATALVGKYLNGYGSRDPGDVPPGWTEWHGTVGNSAYSYYDFTVNTNGSLVGYGNDAASYQTDVYATTAAEIVRRRAPSARPFFLWVSFLAPHATGWTPPSGRRGEAAQPALRHLGRFSTTRLPTPPSFNEADVSDKPAHLQGLPRLDPQTIGAISERYRLRLESLLAVDDAVARVVRELAKSGELANTLIIFTSDNGFLHGEHRLASGKVYLYEPSSRVPLIVRGPGIAAGVRSQLVANVDLAPTIVEAARSRAGLALDGRSLWPILRDRDAVWNRDLLLEAAGSYASALAVTAVRTRRWMYVEYTNGEKELYDIVGDPYELRSLHAARSTAAVRAQLERRLAALRTCAGRSCWQGAVPTR